MEQYCLKMFVWKMYTTTWMYMQFNQNYSTQIITIQVFELKWFEWLFVKWFVCPVIIICTQRFTYNVPTWWTSSFVAYDENIVLGGLWINCVQMKGLRTVLSSAIPSHVNSERTERYVPMFGIYKLIKWLSHVIGLHKIWEFRILQN